MIRLLSASWDLYIKGDVMKEKLSQYKHCLLLLYFPFYLTAFFFLERFGPNKIHIIDCAIDQYIPFVEIFIIPYLLWFAYMLAAGLYFMFCEKESFVRMMCFGMIGMTIFLLVSWLYPNGLELRPEVFTRDNIFIRLTQFIYGMDTPTNVLPSIHVFNSVGICITIGYSEKLRDKKWVRNGAKVLTVLIVLSTMFVKQHSIVDVLLALFLSYISYGLVFDGWAVKLWSSMEEMKYKYQKKARRRSGCLEK